MGFVVASAAASDPNKLKLPVLIRRNSLLEIRESKASTQHQAFHTTICIQTSDISKVERINLKTCRNFSHN